MKIHKLNFNKPSKAKKYLKLSLLLLSVVGATYGAVQVSQWFDFHRLVWQPPIVFQTPVKIEVRKPIEKLVVVDKLPKIKNLTPIEQYICDKFGVYDCKMAIAVARAESNLREDAWNVNGNGSIDVGIFQINSVHFNRKGCSLKELVDAHKNVDCAYSIWKEQGWSPWVTAKNGRFLKFLKEH